jgi:membrane-associated protein
LELLKTFVHHVLHLNDYLPGLVQEYGFATHLILFVVVFCETGLVVTPFLPGDSLLFAAGSLAAIGKLDVWILMALLAAAAVLGDTVNYWFGKKIGPRAFSGTVRFLKQEHLKATEDFYERYGKKTIVLARFVPIIRTFAPFVAGVGSMRYPIFLLYNVVGGVVWVLVGTLAGYFFGNIEIVQKHFTLVILAIIVISVLPMLFEYLKVRRARVRV